MRGVILAAGDATRMGNKMFLPVKCGRQWVPLINYQIEWLADKGIEDVTILVKDDSPLPYYFSGHRVKFLFQEGEGLLSAIRSVSRLFPAVVLACDNYISMKERGPCYSTQPGVTWTARMVPIEMRLDLDLFDEKFTRIKRGEGVRALTYPAMFNSWSDDRTKLYDSDTDSLVFATWNGWFDVGTPASYNKYLQGVIK